MVISNSGLWWNGNGPLKLWLDSVMKAGVREYLLVALDEQVAQAFERLGANYYYRPTKPPKAQAGTGDNHAYSAVKFVILREFLEVGWSVLLSVSIGRSLLPSWFTGPWPELGKPVGAGCGRGGDQRPAQAPAQGQRRGGHVRWL